VPGKDNENLVVPWNQAKNEVHPQSPFPENEVSPLTKDPTSVRDSGSDSLLIEDSTPYRDMGRNSLVSQTNKGIRLRRSKHGGILQ